MLLCIYWVITMSKLGNKIKEIRTSNNLTLQEFADSLGYTSKSNITKIEKGAVKK